MAAIDNTASCFQKMRAQNLVERLVARRQRRLIDFSAGIQQEERALIMLGRGDAMPMVQPHLGSPSPWRCR